MICSNCGHHWRLGSMGMGFSSAPGLFLIAGFVGLIVLLLGSGLQERGYPSLGTLLVICGGGLAAGGFVLIGVARSDATAYGPRHCPNCDAVVEIRPWSF